MCHQSSDLWCGMARRGAARWSMHCSAHMHATTMDDDDDEPEEPLERMQSPPYEIKETEVKNVRARVPEKWGLNEQDETTLTAKLQEELCL